MDLLRSREKLPYVRSFPPDTSERLIILPGEDDPSMPSTARGRPVGPDYYDIERKLGFMRDHGIDISVISLANPWLDFLDPEEAGPTATRTNKEINEICSKHPGKLFAFGALPLSARADIIVEEVHRIKRLEFMRGIVMGTSGLGQGLDDPELEPVWRAIEQTGQLLFLHPHYGLPKEVYGPRASDYGHVLPLALGFPLETTIAVTRMILSGVFDRFADLKILLAHSGGTLPYLAGRVDMCVQHDRHMQKGLKSVEEILHQNVYLDAILYNTKMLSAAASSVGGSKHDGFSNMMFGTDHPFFPPLDKEQSSHWPSTEKTFNLLFRGLEWKGEADGGPYAAPDRKTVAGKLLGGNACRILNLEG